MNDQELDAAIRRLLLDSVERRMRAIDLNDVPQASPSPRHQAQMRAMLQNPLKCSCTVKKQVTENKR